MECEAYWSQEPFGYQRQDYLAGWIAQATLAPHTKRQRNLVDYVPVFRVQKKSAQQLKAIMQQIAQQHNAKIGAA